jgi:hypothetical protein
MYSANDERPRAALLLNTKISYFPLTKFISRDLAAAIIEVPTKKRDTKDSRWGGAAYFSLEDKNSPPPELTDLINSCNRRNIQILIGCDTNTQYKQWGSSDTNEKAEANIQACETRYRRGHRSHSIIVPSRVQNKELWHVSDEPSLSDHRQIFFNMDADRTTQVPRASQGRETVSALKSFWVTPKAVSKEVSKACCPVVHRKVK